MSSETPRTPDSARLVIPALDRGSVSLFEFGPHRLGIADDVERCSELGAAVADRGHDAIDVLAVQTHPEDAPDEPRSLADAVGVEFGRVVGPSDTYLDDGPTLDSAVCESVAPLSAGEAVPLGRGAAVHALNPSRQLADWITSQTEEPPPNRQRKRSALALAVTTAERELLVPGPLRFPATEVATAHHAAADALGTAEAVDTLLCDAETARRQHDLLARTRPSVLHYADRTATHTTVGQPRRLAEAAAYADSVTAASVHGDAVLALDDDLPRDAAVPDSVGVTVTAADGRPKEARTVLDAALQREAADERSHRAALRTFASRLGELQRAGDGVDPARSR